MRSSTRYFTVEGLAGMTLAGYFFDNERFWGRHLFFTSVSQIMNGGNHDVSTQKEPVRTASDPYAV